MTRSIDKQTTVPTSRTEVWKAWSDETEARTFLAPHVRIDLRILGTYEVLFDPEDESQGTKDHRLLSYIPGEMISFEWNSPPHLREAVPERTHVVVQLADHDGGTSVRLLHLSWEEGEAWDQVMAYFEKAWDIVLARLVHRYETGPIDWSDPYYPPE